uniref:Uncharacterized protein n=1 Tax=Arundo donax TaxID=35708 RepID=A0A0A9EKZ4_ARUDO
MLCASGTAYLREPMLANHKFVETVALG